MSKDMERLTEAIEEYAIATNDFDVIAAESISEGVLESTWLAEHDAKVRAEAWDEGEEAGMKNQENWDGWRDTKPPITNPYREEQK